jgi:hypothetical protein
MRQIIQDASTQVDWREDPHQRMEADSHSHSRMYCKENMFPGDEFDPEARESNDSNDDSNDDSNGDSP